MQDFKCHCWSSVDRIVVGSSEGLIFLIKNGLVIQELSFGNQKFINCLQPLKNGFAVGGSGGFVSMFEFSLNEKIEQTKTIPLPDPESIITSMTNTVAEGTLLVEINTNQILKYSTSVVEISKV